MRQSRSSTATARRGWVGAPARVSWRELSPQAAASESRRAPPAAGSTRATALARSRTTTLFDVAALAGQQVLQAQGLRFAAAPAGGRQQGGQQGGRQNGRQGCTRRRRQARPGGEPGWRRRAGGLESRWGSGRGAGDIGASGIVRAWLRLIAPMRACAGRSRPGRPHRGACAGLFGFWIPLRAGCCQGFPGRSVKGRSA